MSVWEETTGRRETYEEALARSEACLNHKPNEQEEAEKIVAARERMRRHDAYLADAFISPIEEVVISRELAKKLGHMVVEHGEWPE